MSDIVIRARRILIVKHLTNIEVKERTDLRMHSDPGACILCLWSKGRWESFG